MDGALTQPLASFHSVRLQSWIALSVAAHALVLFIGGGSAPPSVSIHQPVSMTVEIGYIEPEASVPLVVPGVEPQIEARQSAAEPVQISTGRSTSGMDAAAREPAAERASHSDGYFRAHELDVRSEPINEVLLQYPQIPYLRRIGGVVQFALYINAEGGLDRIEFIKADPPGMFEEAAWEAVKQLRFSPALKNGQRVKSEKIIDVVFDPYDDLRTKPATKRPDSLAAEK